MIVFVYGTTAEAIKIAPIIRRLDARGIPYEQWVTKQHTVALMRILPGLGLPEPTEVIADGIKGKPLDSAREVLPWLLTVWRWVRRNRRGLRARLPRNTVIVVHGDTMTTVVGAWIARRLKLPSAHVEAGLRSGDWRHPFPEEIDRRIVGRWATVHYAPSPEAVRNLAGRANVVDTEGNTVNDAVLDRAAESGEPGGYGIVLLHRFEFMANRDLVERTMAALSEASPLPLRFYVDHFARESLGGLLDGFDPDRVDVRPKLEHEGFVRELLGAELVVTDSGGIQEETALLGIPTLVHRKATERQEGIGRNAVLSHWDVDALRDFLRDYTRYRVPRAEPTRSPSDIVVDDLIRRGWAERR